jgi:cellulose biosynthesis protein BcsQ
MSKSRVKNMRNIIQQKTNAAIISIRINDQQISFHKNRIREIEVERAKTVAYYDELQEILSSL